MSAIIAVSTVARRLRDRIRNAIRAPIRENGSVTAPGSPFATIGSDGSDGVGHENMSEAEVMRSNG